MFKLITTLQKTYPLSIINSIILSLVKRAIVNPSTLIIGKFSSYKIEKKVKISNNCTLDVMQNGLITLDHQVWLSSFVFIQTNSKIEISCRTTIQRNCSINGTVKIGEDCILAPNVFISSGTHIFKLWPEMRIREQEKRYRSLCKNQCHDIDKPVYIGNDCWLGVNSVILPGVTLGDGCIVGANSVVTRSFEKNSIIGGIPAKCIGTRI